MSDDRLIDPLECRTHDPSVAEWTEVKAACERLGIETKRLYNWVYTKNVQGCKKEGGHGHADELRKEGRRNERQIRNARRDYMMERGPRS